VYFVRPGYLHALGAKITGREPVTSDEAAVVVSAAFARRAWPDRNAIGRKLRLGPSARAYEVVGVAGDVRSRGLEKDGVEDVYVPLVPIAGWNGWPPITNMQVIVRAPGIDSGDIEKTVRNAITSIDREVIWERVHPLSDLVAATTAEQSMAVPFVALSALVALVLCAFSLFAAWRESHDAYSAAVSALTPTIVHI
jgi:hypothetical protein